MIALSSNTQGGSLVRELRPPGFVRGRSAMSVPTAIAKTARGVSGPSKRPKPPLAKDRWVHVEPILGTFRPIDTASLPNTAGVLRHHGNTDVAAESLAERIEVLDRAVHPEFAWRVWVIFCR
jgi:hypothetical protein